MTGTAEDSLVLDASVDAAIETCGGDARAAVRALIVANNYLEAEVKRLAESVSSGFRRGFPANGRAEPVFPQFKDDLKWRQDIDSRFPHSVDLVPPEDGFPDAVEKQIVKFLVPLPQRTNRERERLRERIVAAGGAGYLSTDLVELLGLGPHEEVTWACERIIAASRT